MAPKGITNMLYFCLFEHPSVEFRISSVLKRGLLLPVADQQTVGEALEGLVLYAH